MIKKLLSTLLLVGVLFSQSNAKINVKGDKDLLETAKKILPSTGIEKVMPTEIPNVYAVLLSSGDMVYIYPPKELILFGEIYSKQGVNLSEKHVENIGAKKTNAEPIDITPLQKVSVRMKEGNGKYGFIVFTDPDCPFCKQLESMLFNEEVTVDYIYMPLDNLHPNAREKSIKSVMQKRSLSRDEAITLISEGEKIGNALGVNGTPGTIVYEIATKKPVNGISGANPQQYAPYFTQGAKQ